MCVVEYVRVSTGAMEARAAGFSQRKNYRWLVMSCLKGAGDQTQILWKESKYS